MNNTHQRQHQLNLEHDVLKVAAMEKEARIQLTEENNKMKRQMSKSTNAMRFAERMVLLEHISAAEAIKIISEL